MGEYAMKCMTLIGVVIVVYILFFRQYTQSVDTNNLFLYGVITAFVVIFLCRNKIERFTNKMMDGQALAAGTAMMPQPNDNYGNCSNNPGSCNRNLGGALQASVHFTTEREGEDGVEEVEDLTSDDLKPKTGLSEGTAWGVDTILKDMKKEWEDAPIQIPKRVFTEYLMPVNTTHSKSRDIRGVPLIKKCESTTPFSYSSAEENTLQRGFDVVNDHVTQADMTVPAGNASGSGSHGVM